MISKMEGVTDFIDLVPEREGNPWNEEERQERERSASILWSEKTDELRAF